MRHPRPFRGTADLIDRPGQRSAKPATALRHLPRHASAAESPSQHDRLAINHISSCEFHLVPVQRLKLEPPGLAYAPLLHQLSTLPGGAGILADLRSQCISATTVALSHFTRSAAMSAEKATVSLVEDSARGGGGGTGARALYAPALQFFQDVVPTLAHCLMYLADLLGLRGPPSKECAPASDWCSVHPCACIESSVQCSSDVDLQCNRVANSAEFKALICVLCSGARSSSGGSASRDKGGAATWAAAAARGDTPPPLQLRDLLQPSAPLSDAGMEALAQVSSDESPVVMCMQ